MSVEPLSSFHPSVGINSHAHLPQGTTATSSPDLAGLLAEVPFDMEIRGLAASSSAPPHKMYYPRLRKSEATQQVSHLDTISCWRGITHAQATELTLWERLFHQCLISQIEERLRRSIIIQLSKRKDHVDKVTLLPCLIQSFPDNYACFVDIDVVRLLRDMIDAFYDDDPTHTAARNFCWSLDSGDLPSFVYNYIFMQDCFQNTPAGPCLFVEFSINWLTFPSIAITANVAWQPPAFEFKYVPTRIRPGARYVIAPYRRRIVEEPKLSGHKQYHDFVEYIVTKSASAIRWDHTVELFRAQAPDRVEDNIAAVSETILQAKIITRFPGNVRFERTSRYAIKIELTTATTETDQTQTQLTRCTSPPKNSLLSQAGLYRRVSASSSDPLIELIDYRSAPFEGDYFYWQEHTERAPVDDSRHNVCSTESSLCQKSLRKRTHLWPDDAVIGLDETRLHEPHDRSPEAQLKRRKLENANVENIHFGSRRVRLPYSKLCLAEERKSDDEHHEEMMRHHDIPTGVAPALSSTQADSSPPELRNGTEKVLCKKLDRAEKIQYPTPPLTPLTPFLSDFGARNQSVDASHTNTHASPLHHTRTGFKFSSQLSQHMIQHNYREFEAMALQGSTQQSHWDNVSFEKIFLGDSEAEDWHSSDVDGWSEEMNGLEVEQ